MGGVGDGLSVEDLRSGVDGADVAGEEERCEEDGL